jgi:hypothetical protein
LLNPANRAPHIGFETIMTPGLCEVFMVQIRKRSHPTMSEKSINLCRTLKLALNAADSVPPLLRPIGELIKNWTQKW